MNEQDLESAFTKNVYSSRDIRLCHPGWLTVWPVIKQEFNNETGLSLEISCTYRSPMAQHDLYQFGRSKPGKILTFKDGKELLSVHNIFPSKAIDVWVSLAGKAVWEDQYFDAIGPIARKHGLKWGGDFRTLIDKPHLELRV